MTPEKLREIILEASPEIGDAMDELIPEIRKAASDALAKDEGTPKVTVSAKLILNLEANSWAVETSVSTRTVIKSDAHPFDDNQQKLDFGKGGEE